MIRKGTKGKPAKKTGTWEDHYTRKAKTDKYPARSVYKLQEIQRKFTIIKKNDTVLDLGCSPGSWLLYAGELAGPSGRVTGVDLKEVTVKLPENTRAYVGDILELDPEISERLGRNLRVVISDMAPATTGNKSVDTARSFELCSMALDVALERLAPGGAFICKIFQGREFKEFIDLVKDNFKKHNIFKPESCRKQSKEIFIIGTGKK